MRGIKKLLTGSAALALLLSCAFNAFALEVPTETIVRNLDGVQEYIKVYTVSPEADAAELIEPPFDYNGYTYTYTGIVKVENTFEDKKEHVETMTVETEKKDMDVVLAALEPSIEYDDGTWHGILNLDHTTIQTEAAGYKSGSYAVTEVKEIGNLNSNDMSYVPATAVKNGITLQLSNVDWQVQSTDLVDDVLVPASYVAVATYTGTAWYNTATGYISTAEYVGEVTSEGVGSVTYTLTYTGTPIVPMETKPEAIPEPERTPEPVAVETETPNPFQENASQKLSMPTWAWIVGGTLLVLVIALGVILVIALRKRGAHEARYYEMEGNDYEDQN